MKSNWSIDEDETLKLLTLDLSYNWQLIHETMQSLHVGAGEKRTEWEYFYRYKFLKEQPVESKIVPNGKKIKNSAKQDAVKRHGKIMSLYEIILRKVKQRPERLTRGWYSKNAVSTHGLIIF
jgi:hypothetical protein